MVLTLGFCLRLVYMNTESCNVVLLQALYDVDDFLSEHLKDRIRGTIILRERWFCLSPLTRFSFSGYPVAAIFFAHDVSKA